MLDLGVAIDHVRHCSVTFLWDLNETESHTIINLSLKIQGTPLILLQPHSYVLVGKKKELAEFRVCTSARVQFCFMGGGKREFINELFESLIATHSLSYLVSLVTRGKRELHWHWQDKRAK